MLPRGRPLATRRGGFSAFATIGGVDGGAAAVVGSRSGGSTDGLHAAPEADPSGAAAALGCGAVSLAASAVGGRMPKLRRQSGVSAISGGTTGGGASSDEISTKAAAALGGAASHAEASVRVAARCPVRTISESVAIAPRA